MDSSQNLDDYLDLIAHISEHNLDNVSDLLEMGVNPNRNPNVPGYSPLEFAIRNRDIAMVHALLDYGADPNDRNSKGDSALIFTFRVSRILKPEIVKLLINYGADPELENNNNDTAYTVLELRRPHLSLDRYQELLSILNSFIPTKDPGYD